ncbi:MAG: hypothetical protein WDO73_31155 [Ignavibacteriota bacterium]
MTYGDGNQGLIFSTTVNPSNAYASTFGPAGSVLFSQPNLPVYAGPSSPQYPLTPAMSNSLYTYDPHIKIPYVQSWNAGFQRQISKNSAIEVRYTGNHGIKYWRQVNLNELNTFENGFQSQFYAAQENLFINRGCQGAPSSPGSWNSCSNPNSNSFANAGLPGQSSNIGILTTAFGGSSDVTTATALRQNNVGSLANTYQTNTTDYGRLMAAGYRPNLFVVNPAVTGANIFENGGWSRTTLCRWNTTATWPRGCSSRAATRGRSRWQRIRPADHPARLGSRQRTGEQRRSPRHQAQRPLSAPNGIGPPVALGRARS